MSVKLYIKNHLPEKVLDKAVFIKNNIDSMAMSNYDKTRFRRYYSSNLKKMNQTQIEARLIFYAHSIEKGLSHDNIRCGFGKKALQLLSTVLDYYRKNNFDKNRVAYQNALSVLKSYIEIHKSNNYDTSYLNLIFGDEIIAEARKCNKDIGGAITISYKDKKNDKDFASLFNSRSSVREFSSEPVDVNKIKNAIQLSMKSPSVCNRQTSRVYVVTNKNKIEELLKVQGGMTGYSAPPILMAVTSCIGGFLHLTERNQPFIDGGLFSMSLLLSLENEGLAACPLNTMFNKKQDLKTRSIIDLKQDENLIMYIAVGNFKDTSKIAKSFRLSGDEITTFVN